MIEILNPDQWYGQRNSFRKFNFFSRDIWSHSDALMMCIIVCKCVATASCCLASLCFYFILYLHSVLCSCDAWLEHATLLEMYR